MTTENKEVLLKDAQKVIKAFNEVMDGEELYLELHCGSSGGQTQWHTHLRFERTQGSWRGVSWWDQIKAHF